MRLSGLAAGIATFGVLEITHDVLRYWDKIGPDWTPSAVPETTGLLQAAVGAGSPSSSRSDTVECGSGGCSARRGGAAAARAVGVCLYAEARGLHALRRSRGFAGGLFVHLLPVNAERFYLDLTFITLAMLVIGGATSLWGAVVGAVVVSAMDSFLAEAENGVHLFGRSLDLPGRDTDRGRRRTHGARPDPAADRVTGGREFRSGWPGPGAF